MPVDTKTVYLERTIRATPEQVYFTLTHATTLREFLCQVATLHLKPGGRIYLCWSNGYYTAGEFTRIEENRALAFTWLGRGMPGSTQVEIELTTQEEGVKVALTHSGFGSGPAWEQAFRESERGWKEGLDNLASVLETGRDLRFVLRPMMGVLGAEFNAKIAAELGVPVTAGVRLGNVVGGLSARVAGLQKDDVLVEMGGMAIEEFGDLGLVLGRHRAGEVIEVVYYRGAERRTVPMTLTPRPLPEIPWTASALAAALEARYAEGGARLDALFAGVSEAEASFQPAPGDWSAKGVLAHLIQGERGTQDFILEVVAGEETWSDGYGDNLPAYIDGMLAAYPTLGELLTELKRGYRVTTAVVAGLPAEFLERRKGSYWRLAYNFLQPDYHLIEHLDQMKASIEAAKRQA